MTDNILSADGLYKSFGDNRILRGLQLSIARGSIYALLGANGAGKSTFYKIAAGLLTPDDGSLRIDEDPVVQPRRASHIGYVSQELAIYPRLTVRQNLAFLGRLGGLHGRLLDDAISNAAEIFCITTLLDRTAGMLSGGEKRRLHAAMGVVSRPTLLLLDEPTAGVDVETRNHILQGVKDLAVQGMSICYTTHYFHEVVALDPVVGIIESGQILCSGRLENLLAEHGKSVVEMKFKPSFIGRNFPSAQKIIEQDYVFVRIEMTDETSSISKYIDMIEHEDRSSLISIEIIRPSLESVFLNITGKRHKNYEL